MAVEVFKGNKREIPAGMPPTLWRDRVLELSARPEVADIPWYHPWMESLTPDELARVRAKALIWRNITGDWPDEIAWWLEIRMARRRGDIPHLAEVVEAHVDEDGILHCGKCEARWSKPMDGESYPDRCKLCDRLWIVFVDEKQEVPA